MMDKQIAELKKKVDTMQKQMEEDENQWREQAKKQKEKEDMIRMQLEKDKKMTKKSNDEDDLAIDNIDEIMDSPEKRMYGGKAASINKTDETSNIPRSEADELDDEGHPEVLDDDEEEE